MTNRATVENLQKLESEGNGLLGGVKNCQATKFAQIIVPKNSSNSLLSNQKLLKLKIQREPEFNFKETNDWNKLGYQSAFSAPQLPIPYNEILLSRNNGLIIKGETQTSKLMNGFGRVIEESSGREIYIGSMKNGKAYGNYRFFLQNFRCRQRWAQQKVLLRWRFCEREGARLGHHV